jgi:hypothetical protein
MPDRLPEAVDTLIAEIRDLNGLVRVASSPWWWSR